MEIRRIVPTEYNAVKALVLDVFMEFEAPDYGAQGVETFQRESIENGDYMETLDVLGAYKDDQLAGVIATRSSGSHIALFFVRGAYHRQGIGRALFEAVQSENMTVNSSPYAEKVYERLGFIRTDTEQTFEGMRFIPMKYAPAVRALLERLTPKDTREGYQALLELETLSDETGSLYPYTQQFADMVASELYVVRVRGFRLFCKQAKWDTDCGLDENIDRALAILRDPKPTAVRMALAALLDALPYKPELRQTILTAAQSINYAQYKDSMQGLICKDVQKLCRENCL